ncbi:hypothetical protein [Sphingomonas koreensis]|uniref:hypothetical protein n=1 Tax=Sphingomonas koreensis TaxID=93064 RepID=UPI0013DDDB39|nr:hypothetical protein [Sphingomonas koreensis]MDC7809974.1 hypothetical protein [Sphingomonas koreensis]
MAAHRNPGFQPNLTKGKRARVTLANGTVHEWTADTSRWTLTGDPFDIAHYEVL